MVEKKKRKRKKKGTEPAPRPPRGPKPAPGCALGDPQCEAYRVHDWQRAHRTVSYMLESGKIRLCEGHRNKLNGIRVA